ncbi:MAG: hypothetical protein PF503_08970, partial [Desulfobacula sp.]|nr:hypothetical protein [Desulfobacula sp.]
MNRKLTNRNSQKEYASGLFLAVTFVFIAVFYGQGLFTNSTTPSGDAKRIRTYVNTFNSIESVLPLWVPNKNGGTPLFADPEQLFYCFLTPLLSFGGDDYYNLNLNILIYIFLCIHAAAVYLLLRCINVSGFASVAGAVLATCSGIVYLHYLSGRLNFFTFLSASIFLLPVYKRWFDRKGIGMFAVLSALIGLQIVVFGYYTLLPVIVLGFFAFGLRIDTRCTIWSAVKCTSRDLAGALFCSMGLFAFILIPMIHFQLDFLSTSGFERFLELPYKGSFLNVFMPLITSGKGVQRLDSFEHASLLLLPGILIFCSQKNQKNSASVWALVIAGFLFFLTVESFFLPAMNFQKLYAQIPFVRDIRHGLVYTYYAEVLWLCVAVYAIDRMTFKPGYIRLIFASLLICVLIVVVDWLGVYYGEQNSYYIVTYGWQVSIFLGIILSIIIFYCMTNRYKRFSVAVLSLAVLCQVMILNLSVTGYGRTKNETFWDRELKNRVGKVNHERLISRPNHCPPFGWEDQARVFGFSLYFSPYYRTALGYLLDRTVFEQRPHWIDTDFSSVTEEGLEMFNVKFGLYRKDQEPPPALKWEKLAKKGAYILWEYTPQDVNSSGIKLFDNWKVVNYDQIDTKEVREAWKKDII